MKHFFEKNKIFIAIVIGAFIIGSFIYFSVEPITQLITFSHLPTKIQIQKFNHFSTDKMIKYYPLLNKGAMQEFVREAENGIIKPTPRMSTLYLMLTHQFNEDWAKKALKKGLLLKN